MTALEGQSHETIAGTSGVSIGTIKSRVSRARARLRQMLDVEVGDFSLAAPSRPARPRCAGRLIAASAARRRIIRPIFGASPGDEHVSTEIHRRGGDPVVYGGLWRHLGPARGHRRRHRRGLRRCDRRGPRVSACCRAPWWAVRSAPASAPRLRRSADPGADVCLGSRHSCLICGRAPVDWPRHRRRVGARVSDGRCRRMARRGSPTSAKAVVTASIAG